MSFKYEKIFDYLDNFDDLYVKLSFDEIEKIMGEKLPPSFYTTNSYFGVLKHKKHSAFMLSTYEYAKTNKKLKYVLFKKREKMIYELTDVEIAKLTIEDVGRYMFMKNAKVKVEVLNMGSAIPPKLTWSSFNLLFNFNLQDNSIEYYVLIEDNKRLLHLQKENFGLNWKIKSIEMTQNC